MTDPPTLPIREQKVLRGPNYSLSPFQEEDVLDRYIGWLNDPDVNRFLEVRFAPQSYQTVLEYVRSFYGKDEKYLWGVYPNGSGSPIGTITLSAINRNHGSGGIGLLIGEKAYWGKGAATEAIELVAQFAFETLDFHRLYAEVMAPNERSNRLFQKVGFALEGKLRQAHFLSPGCYVDGYRWGILSDEWRARKHKEAGGRTGGDANRVPG